MTLLRNSTEASELIYPRFLRKWAKMIPRKLNSVLLISTLDYNALPMLTDKTSPSSKLLPWLKPWTKTSTLSVWDLRNGSHGISPSSTELWAITWFLPNSSISLRREKILMKIWKIALSPSFLTRRKLNKLLMPLKSLWVKRCLRPIFFKLRVSQRELSIKSNSEKGFKNILSKEWTQLPPILLLSLVKW